MIVFANTTPIIALSSIHQIDLLPTLFHEIYVVDAIIEECAAGGKIVVPDLTQLPWIRIVKSEPCEDNYLTSFVTCVQAMQRQGIRYNTHLLKRLALQVGETFQNL